MALFDRKNIYTPEDGNLKWWVSVPPAIEPITADDVKLYARIDGSSEDDIIELFISAVREATEKYLGRALIEQTMIASLDYFSKAEMGAVAYTGDDTIFLPRPPLISVTSLSVLDEEDVETIYDSDKYYVRADVEPGQLIIKYENTPPLNYERFRGGYKIVFQAGYGDEATDVPAAIRLGMIMWASDIYENRVPIDQPPGIVETIMSPYRVIPL
jgi:uncharacterized phiE125 gp8 family phage protein